MLIYLLPFGPISVAVMDNDSSDFFSPKLIFLQIFFLNKISFIKNLKMGRLPGLVVNVEDSQSEPWSLDVSSIPGFT